MYKIVVTTIKKRYKGEYRFTPEAKL